MDGGIPSVAKRRDDAGNTDVKVRQAGRATSTVDALDPSAAAVCDPGAVGAVPREAETAHGLLLTGLEVADGEPESVVGGVAVHESQPSYKVAWSPIEWTADTNKIASVARCFLPAIWFNAYVWD